MESQHIFLENWRESIIKGRINNPSNQDNLYIKEQQKYKAADCLISLQIRQRISNKDFMSGNKFFKKNTINERCA